MALPSADGVLGSAGGIGMASFGSGSGASSSGPVAYRCHLRRAAIID
jgi:hypothetical protein